MAAPGAIRVGTLGGVTLLTVPAGAGSPAAVAWPNYGTNSGPPRGAQNLNNPFNSSQWHQSTTYGNDSGVRMLAAAGFTKWVFQLAGPAASMTGTAAFGISIYGTVDPGILAQTYSNPSNSPGYSYVEPECSLTLIPGTDWFLLPGPSEQAGTGSVSNPMTTNATGGSMFFCNMPLIAVRAVLTTAPTTGAGSLRVLGFAVP